MTMHQSAIDRMQREGMVALAAETVRRKIADLDGEITASRRDISDQLARIRQDELYIADLETEAAALRDRLRQLEEMAS